MQEKLSALWRDHSIRIPLIVFLVLRIATGIAIQIMVSQKPAPPPEWLDWNPSGQTYFIAIPEGAPLASLVEPWHRWDTAWYIKIAIQGYKPDTSIVFPPLYPILIRLVAPFTFNNYVLAALLISNSCCLIAFILFYKLVQRDFGDESLASRALICLAAFPTSYYLVAGYSETLFMALALGAWLSAQDRRWWLAGLLAALATLTRLQGLVLALPLAWIAYIQYRDSERWIDLRGWIARAPLLIGAPIGGAIYLGTLAANNLGTLEAAYAREWRLFTRSPLESITAYFARLDSGRTANFEDNNARALLFIVITGLIATCKLTMTHKLYFWATLLAVMVRYHQDGPQFESVIRYALLFFPCFIVTGMILRKWWLLPPYILGCAYLQWQLLDRFTHWIWVA